MLVERLLIDRYDSVRVISIRARLQLCTASRFKVNKWITSLPRRMISRYEVVDQ